MRSVRRISDPRSAFTLVELMIVMTIMAILMSMVVAVVGSFLSSARTSATSSTLAKIQAMLNSRAQALDRQLKIPQWIQGQQEYNYVKANYPTLASQTKLILATKLIEMRYFPQSTADIATLQLVYPANTQAGQFLNGMYPKLIAAINAGTSTVTNSQILCDFLTQEGSIGDTPIGTDAFSADQVGTFGPNDAMPSFKDGWGNPIRFYRWPTRLIRPNGINGRLNGVATGFALTPTGPPAPAPTELDSFLALLPGVLPAGAITATGQPNFADLGRDPDDPLQRCVNLVNFETTFHTPATLHFHLVVSAGADGALGLGEPDSMSGFDRLAFLDTTTAIPLQLASDNIFSCSIRAGGK